MPCLMSSLPSHFHFAMFLTNDQIFSWNFENDSPFILTGRVVSHVLRKSNTHENHKTLFPFVFNYFEFISQINLVQSCNVLISLLNSCFYHHWLGHCSCSWQHWIFFLFYDSCFILGYGVIYWWSFPCRHGYWCRWVSLLVLFLNVVVGATTKHCCWHYCWARCYNLECCCWCYCGVLLLALLLNMVMFLNVIISAPMKCCCWHYCWAWQGAPTLRACFQKWQAKERWQQWAQRLRVRVTFE